MSTLPGPLAGLTPVSVAPMAGGPSTPGLVRAAAAAGCFAQLGGGYLTADALNERIGAVRAGGAGPFGVNLFVPSGERIDPDVYRRYAASLRADAERYGVGALPEPTEDDDGYPDKVALLLEDPVPVVSFTFGLPSAGVVRRLRQQGSVVLQTVTSPGEARAAAERGADALVVQAAAAGGHSGILDPAALPPDVPLPALVEAVHAVVDLPVIGTGGVGSAVDVAAALAAGAAAVAVGTAVLRSPEAGTSPVHRAALGDPAFSRTALTRAFTGRLARGLVNRFLEEHDRDAPVGYPAVHHLTRPIRLAAAAAGDPSAVHLWAGTGWRAAREEPVARILRGLVP